MKFIQHVLLIIFLLVMSACDKKIKSTHDYKVLLAHLEDKEAQDQLSLYDVFKEDVERYYLFSEYADEELISNVLGFKVPIECVSPNYRKLIGVSDNSIKVNVDLPGNQIKIHFGTKNNYDPLLTTNPICILSVSDRIIPTFVIGSQCDTISKN